MTDEQLVSHCRAGDEAAWCELVERFSPYVHAILVRGYRLGDEAEDAFQDVFVRVHSRLRTLDGTNAIRPWIAQVTRRVALDRLRATGRRPVTTTMDIDQDDPTDRLGEIESAMDVRAALGTLDPVSAEILDRFFARDESYATIAAALGIAPGTVASRISRGLERLRATMADAGSSVPAAAS